MLSIKWLNNMDFDFLCHDRNVKLSCIVCTYGMWCWVLFKISKQLSIDFFNVCSYNMVDSRNYIESVHFPIVQSNTRHDSHICVRIVRANVQPTVKTAMESLDYQLQNIQAKVFEQMCPLRKQKKPLN